MIPDPGLARYAHAVLAYTVGVVLVGAVVRATGSGAGCGANWPTCGDDFIPLSGDAERFVEFAHRASSGVALVLVAVLVVAAFRRHAQGSPVRSAALLSGVLILNEALIGAALVLFEWVADDASVARLISATLHLVNTFFLLAALLATARLAAGDPVPKRPFPRAIRWVGIGFVVVGALGAITALGDTLFPPEEIAGGVLDDLRGVLIVRLRWVHPIAAVVVAVAAIRMAVRSDASNRWAAALRRAVLAQVGLGLLNVVLLAPLWMQVVHLLAADIVWLLFVLFALESGRDRVPVAT